MNAFNSYTVYNEEGYLIANGRTSGGGAASSPEPYFESLSSGIQHHADVMLVLQECGFVAKYKVEHSTVQVSKLRQRMGLGN